MPQVVECGASRRVRHGATLSAGAALTDGPVLDRCRACCDASQRGHGAMLGSPRPCGRWRPSADNGGPPRPSRAVRLWRETGEIPDPVMVWSREQWPGSSSRDRGWCTPLPPGRPPRRRGWSGLAGPAAYPPPADHVRQATLMTVLASLQERRQGWRGARRSWPSGWRGQRLDGLRPRVHRTRCGRGGPSPGSIRSPPARARHLAPTFPRGHRRRRGWRSPPKVISASPGTYGRFHDGMSHRG